MRYIVARFNISKENYKELKIGNYDLLIYENDVIEGTKLLRDSKLYNKDNKKAAWVKLQNGYIFSNQNDIRYFYNRIKQGIIEDKTYYLLIDTFEVDYFGFPTVVWVGESLNNKAIENLIFNIQAINLINQVKPKIVIPMHYKVEGSTIDIDTKENFISN